ncbi:sporulation integral membrane protein YtvI [Fictibacillus macauensis ZFHKF-1]|uniref:Sporulation integral membrane protein YtvI n=1 Tax=Fictibacillus macauensis ZFHKF-1 TaxID=1196324 RepID=I8UF51_9BACL|nr:sporulation integral membrane protein YtvI [Fictibacillus macauensis]EIT85438.1 sporulation integral membrane protein YtvI [Fictibacillus macauensis ZFHKF-1]
MQRLLRFLLVVVTAGVVFILCFYLSKVTYPFIFGAIIAMIINPFVNFLVEKGRFPRSAAVCTALLLLIAIVAGMILLLLREFFSGISYLAHTLPTYSNDLIYYLETFFSTKILPIYNDISKMFSALDDSHQHTIMKTINELGAKLGSSISQAASSLINALSGLFVQLPTLVTTFIFSLLAAFFMSKDWYRFSRYLSKTASEKWAKSARTVYIELRKALFGFAKAQLTLISITAIIVLIGLLILRVKYAITIALLIGVVDLLPYLGTGVAFVPWIAYTFLSGNYPLTIGLSILYGVIIIQRQVAEPKILSSTIGLDPLATLIALFVGYQWFGFIGLIVGPAFLVLLRALHQANFFKELYQFIKGQ